MRRGNERANAFRRRARAAADESANETNDVQKGEALRQQRCHFVGIDGARFKRPVEPGDQLILDITIDRVRGGIWKFNGVGRVGDEVACEAQLMCTMRHVG